MTPGIDGVVKLLAVLGAAALGAFASGLLLQVVVRLTTRQKVPPLALRVVRLLGAVVLAWLVALWLFGGGGWGVGGSGLGSGKGSGPNVDPKAPAEKGIPDEEKKEKKVADSSSLGGGPEVLRIEVLGPQPLQKLAGGKEFDALRCYRVETDGRTELWTLAEIKEHLLDRLKKGPPLRGVVVVLYRDSPERKVPRVDDLKKLIEDVPARADGTKVRLDISEPDEKAPVP